MPKASGARAAISAVCSSASASSMAPAVSRSETIARPTIALASGLASSRSSSNRAASTDPHASSANSPRAGPRQRASPPSSNPTAAAGFPDTHRRRASPSSCSKAVASDSRSSMRSRYPWSRPSSRWGPSNWRSCETVLASVARDPAVVRRRQQSSNNASTPTRRFAHARSRASTARGLASAAMQLDLVAPHRHRPQCRESQSHRAMPLLPRRRMNRKFPRFAMVLGSFCNSLETRLWYRRGATVAQRRAASGARLGAGPARGGPHPNGGADEVED